MPSLKPLDAFPPEYPGLLVKACERGAFSIPHSSPAAAKATRADLYTYRTVLRGEALRGNIGAAKRAILFHPLTFTITGSTLIITDNDHDTFLSDLL